MRVAIQGTHGAFSEAAARRRWPELEAIPCREVADAVAAVREGRADAGCLPIENSLIGSVTATYDLLHEAFGDGTLALTHETLLPVHHTIMAVPGARVEDIRRVYSHPVALGQCRRWLSKHLPNAELVSAWDTAGSAEMVAAHGDPTEAAIAALPAAAAHGLVPLAERIEDDPTNQTRFLIFSRQGAPAAPAGSGPFKTSLIVSLDHRPGHAGAHAARLQRARRQPHGTAVAARAVGAVDLPVLRRRGRCGHGAARRRGAGGSRGTGGATDHSGQLRGLDGGRTQLPDLPSDAGAPREEAGHPADRPAARPAGLDRQGAPPRVRWRQPGADRRTVLGREPRDDPGDGGRGGKRPAATCCGAAPSSRAPRPTTSRGSA